LYWEPTPGKRKSMPYQALARKLRPKNFGEVVGQDAIVKTLMNAMATGKIHPAYIFSGIRGVGKTTVARILAKGLNCQAADKPTSEPCGSCDSCQEITRGVSMDVLEIDGATHTKAEEARDLTQIALYTPARDRYRVFLIDEVHMLSNAAFNALLKTLEEPPPHVVFLLATTLPHKIPETIHSRAQHFEFRRVPPSRLSTFLAEICSREEIAVEAGAVDLIARAGEGSVRDSLTILDRLAAYSEGTITEVLAQELLGVVGRDSLFGFVDAFASSDSRAVLVQFEEILDRGHDLERFLRDISGHVRRLLRERTTGVQHDSDEPEELTARFQKQASSFSPEDLMRLQDLLLNTLSRLRGAPDPETLVELQLVKAAHLPRILPLQEVLAGMEARVEGSAGPPPTADSSRDSGIRQFPSESSKGGGEPSAKEEKPSGGLRFTSIIPSKQMDEEEVRSYTEESPRTEEIRKRLIKEFPLAGHFLEDATLSVEDGNVLHLALPASISVGLTALNTPDRAETIQKVAKEMGFDGGVIFHKREPDPMEVEADLRPVDEMEAARNHPAVKKVQKILGGQVIDVKMPPPAEPGDEDAESEQDA
jgi:DNA polymerase-3 subunit gamma/tau